MATAKRSGRKARRWPWVLLLFGLGLLVLFSVNRQTIDGFAITGTSYGARVMCSCRFVGGRDLDDCTKDFETGMELVQVSEDTATKSVTASIPLVESQTATYREGYGCVLEDWDG